jgi:hypothetical protein
MNNELRHVTLKDIYEQLAKVEELEYSSGKTLYMEMHRETLKDLILDPDVASYINYATPSVSAQDQVERLFGHRIFVHNDDDRRFVLTLTYKTDILLGDGR